MVLGSGGREQSLLNKIFIGAKRLRLCFVQPAAASCGKFTPPLRIVRVQPVTRSSAMSSLSASHEAHTASAASSTPVNPMDEFTLSDSSEDDAPSPKKALPDFTTRKPDDDSVASGDDSIGWEVEEDYDAAATSSNQIR